MPDGWLYCSAKLALINPVTFSKRLTVVRTGENINDVIWEKIISVSNDSYNQVLDIQPTPDGNWVAVSQLIVNGLQPPEIGPSYLSGGIYKITPDGDSLWSRIDTVFWHPECGADNYLGGIATLSSGSIVAAGYANSICYTNERTYGWVIKVSKDGCLDTLCVVSSAGVEKAPDLDFNVYPNPATDFIYISNPIPQDEHLQFNLFDNTGKWVYKSFLENAHENRVEVRSYANGMYFYSITQNGSLLRTGKLLISR
jgi:hypothetical protein